MEENTTTATPEDDLRSNLEEAFDEKAPEPEQNEPESPSEAEKPAEEPEKSVETAQNEPLNSEINEKTADKGEKDPKKPFVEVKKPNQPPSVHDETEKTEKDPIAKAPQAWKPSAREHWDAIPEEARREIVRHEEQVKEALRKTVKERQFADAVRQTVEPYRATIEGEGGTVVQAIGQLMQTAQALRTAPPPHKAQLVAGLIKQFGVDVQQLDSALAGQQPQTDPVAERIEKELAPVRQWQQQMAQQQQMQEQQEQQRINQLAQEFYATEPEFIDDVRDMMVQIYDGQMPLQEAYDRACWANPEIRSILQKRAQAEQASQVNQQTQKAKRAAVSVQGSAPPANTQASGGANLRDDIEFALSKLAR